MHASDAFVRSLSTIATNVTTVAVRGDCGADNAPAAKKKKKKPKKSRNKASAHDDQAARGEDVTAAAQEVEDGPAKQKRKKRPKSNKKPFHGAGIEAEETYDGAFVHIFILLILLFV